MTADQSRPVPRASAVGSIDRAALLREIDHAWSHAQRNDVLADRILALLRPVEGVTLTREEAEVVIGWHQIALGEGAASGPTARALRARLEASS